MMPEPIDDFPPFGDPRFTDADTPAPWYIEHLRAATQRLGHSTSPDATKDPA